MVNCAKVVRLAPASEHLTAALLASGCLQSLVTRLLGARDADANEAGIKVRPFTSAQLLSGPRSVARALAVAAGGRTHVTLAFSLQDLEAEIADAVADSLYGMVEAAADCPAAPPFSLPDAWADGLPEGMPMWDTLSFIAQEMLPAAQPLASALLDWWRQPEQEAGMRLQLAQAAAARSCAYLRCTNLGAEGGPAAGEGVGSMRCRWVWREKGWWVSEGACRMPL